MLFEIRYDRICTSNLCEWLFWCVRGNRSANMDSVISQTECEQIETKIVLHFDLTLNLHTNEFNIVTRTASFTRSRLGTLSSSKVVHTYSCASCKFLANKYAFSIIPVCMGMRIIIRYSNCVMWKICTKNLCECMCLYAYEHYSCQHESSRSPNGAFSREHIETTITFDIQTLEPILQHVESRMYASVCLMNVLRAYYSIVYHSYISRFYDSVQCAYWRFYFPIKWYIITDASGASNHSLTFFD